MRDWLQQLTAFDWVVFTLGGSGLFVFGFVFYGLLFWALGLWR